jgi:hypothetical protein
VLARGTGSTLPEVTGATSPPPARLARDCASSFAAIALRNTSRSFRARLSISVAVDIALDPKSPVGEAAAAWSHCNDLVHRDAADRDRELVFGASWGHWNKS